MILLDTNILLRAAQPSHSHHQLAIEAVKQARSRGYIPSIFPQVVYEYWVVATWPASENGLGMTVPEAEADISRLLRLFHLFRDERAILDHWKEVVVQYKVHGKTAHDARLVAAMVRHGIEHILTFNDQHFKRFTNILVIHPTDVENLKSM